MSKNQIGRSGFTLIELMIVVSVIGVLAAIGIPNYVHARQNAQTSACVKNLFEIDGAKQQWALEHGRASTATPVETDIQPYIGRGAGANLPVCPNDAQKTFTTSYTINDVITPPVCNILGEAGGGDHILQ
jgi:general secretion pathway protein G